MQKNFKIRKFLAMQLFIVHISLISELLIFLGILNQWNVSLVDLQIVRDYCITIQ